MSKSNKPITGVALGITFNVDEGEVVNLECGYKWSILKLPDGDQDSFINLCGYQTSLSKLKMEAIPEELPSGLEFVDSMEVIVMNGSQEVTVLPRNSSNTISFLVDPKTSLDAKYSIFYWDPDTSKGEGGWVSLPVLPAAASVGKL